MYCETFFAFSTTNPCETPNASLNSGKIRKYLDNGDIYEEAVLNEDAYRDFNNG